MVCKRIQAEILCNPGKSYSLMLVVRYVCEVNLPREGNGLNFAGKATIMMGVSWNTNGLWEIWPPTAALQKILEKHWSVLMHLEPLRLTNKV